MKIIVAIGHPAQFHLFKNIGQNLIEQGHQLKIVATDKDILIELLKKSKFDFGILAERKKNENIFHKIHKILRSTIQYYKISKKFSPDVMIGCLSQMAWIGWWQKIPTIFCAEDDFDYTWMQGVITYPFVSVICSPAPVNVGPFKRKKISYEGYQKLSYLHPNVFIPDETLIPEIYATRPYYIIRLVKLSAYHDIKIAGIDTELLIKIITRLETKGKVYLSSESKLPDNFDRYVLPMSINHIHHAMFFSDLYIGDSQSMAVEAAMLGVPNIRYNGFVGKINVLEELQNKYKLTIGVHTSYPEILLSTIEEFLKDADTNETYRRRREYMLGEKIDVTAFFTWFIENYPESKKIMKENPDYQYRFK